jgi:hypothetical protein
MKMRAIVWLSLVPLACGNSSSSPAGPDASPFGQPAARAADAAASPVKDAAASGPGGDGGAASNPPHGRQQSCCVNGVFYACATGAAFEKCSGFDLSSCFQACAPSDQACTRACDQAASTAKRDPSSCTHDPTRDTECPDAGPNGSSSIHTSSRSSSDDPGAPPPAGAPATPKNACGGPFLGIDCDLGMQCIANQHCTGGKCYPADVGNPCIYRTDCGANNHCTNGCCANPKAGSPCDTAIDCTSSVCTNGVCQ